jgi:tetratricopeptide (TPR) repeat protein
MLFDLRGGGRRRAIQAIYLTLAILMGGGLVLFGIGGNVSGGLVDAIQNDGGQSGDDVAKQRVESLQKRVAAQPTDAGAWAELARAQYQTAGTDIDANTGAYTDAGKAKLAAAGRAWDRHLAVAGDKPDSQVANLMVQVYAALGQFDKATGAMEIVVDARPKSPALYAQLAQYAYAAGQKRKGDLAADRAVELAPKDQKEQLKSQLQQAESSAIQQQVQDAVGQSPTTP